MAQRIEHGGTVRALVPDRVIGLSTGQGLSAMRTPDFPFYLSSNGWRRVDSLRVFSPFSSRRGESRRRLIGDGFCARSGSGAIRQRRNSLARGAGNRADSVARKPRRSMVILVGE